MARIISLISNDIKSGKTTIAFNIATLLGNKNKKTLLVNLEHKSSYLKLMPNKNSTVVKNIIKPFELVQYEKHFSILILSDSKINCKKLLLKQIQLLTNKYDYIILDTSYIWNDLTNECLRISKEVFLVYDSKNFVTNELRRNLNFIRKLQPQNPNLKLTTIMLNNYDLHRHMEALLEINKLTNNKYLLITLPFQKELLTITDESIKFIKYNKATDYADQLSKVINHLINE
ncbi:MAG: AAA family ATPase [Mycoplasmataceae bacterium]|jgi:cellulose biosynthesis protein BcsQ|nr:AAA family ATPase [Mycoplasmataceae bacterium]